MEDHATADIAQEILPGDFFFDAQEIGLTHPESQGHHVGILTGTAIRHDFFSGTIQEIDDRRAEPLMRLDRRHSGQDLFISDQIADSLQILSIKIWLHRCRCTPLSQHSSICR